ncbi:phosphate-starvation-inducible protein PsiE [Lactobacillus johnsonii]|nr:phosphate-starvation-inducible protein PsiE [Lactobacillus johnsonii]
MKKFNKTASKYANILRFFTIIALGILGALMLILMFSQLFAIGRIMISNNLINIPTKVLDEIVTFFLFFEFLAMIVAALKHMGHTSLNFLMSLGITALLRNLITAHGEPMQILIHAVAILLLIIGVVILNKHIKL